jgi:uncharacterized membrane protein
VLVLDFIRLTAMLLMIQGHTLAALLDPARLDLGSFPWQAWEGLRGLTAPMFLLVSGAATVLGIRHGADGRIPRALLLRRIRVAFTVAAIGYLLVFPANRLADLRWVSPDIWRAFLQVGILQLNGLTLLLLTLLLALTRTVRRYAAWSLGLGALILAAAPLVATVDWFRHLPEGLAAYLSFDHGSLFPLFPYSAYMFLGVGLGALLLETPAPERGRRFRLACLAAGCSCLLFSLAAEHLPWQLISLQYAYRGGYAYTSFRLGFTLLLFGGLAWAAQLCPRLEAAAAPLGRRSLFVYVGHLVVLYGTPWTAGLATGRLHSLTVGEGVLEVLLVGSITLGVVLLRDWIRGRSRPLGMLIHASALLALACALIW